MKLVDSRVSNFYLNKVGWINPIHKKCGHFYLFVHQFPAKFIEPVNLLEISIRNSAIENIRENSQNIT